MSEFAALSLSECATALTEIEKPLVVMHTHPDADTVGSCAALSEIFKALGKEVRYTCSDKIPERLDFLIEGLVRDDNTEGYDAVAIDVASPTQLGELCSELGDKLCVKLMIDHHEVGTPFAPHYILHGTSSAGEVLYGIARELEARGDIVITKRMASLLYAAISSDTGGFIYSNTSPDTYRCAAELIERGIDGADINHRLFNSKSEEEIRAEGFVATKLTTAYGGKVAYAEITLDDIKALGVSLSTFECAIDVVRALRGVEIAFVVKEQSTGVFKISLRSTGADVASIAKLHGGGGHIRAAGCTVFSDKIGSATQAILDEIKGVL